MTKDTSVKRRGVVVDIAVLIDTSLSMRTLINTLQSNIGAFIAQMNNYALKRFDVNMNWRVKVCGYRDASQDASMWWQEKPFTTDIAQVHSDLAALEAKGGKDEPESLLDGLWKLAKLPVAAKGEAGVGDMWRHHHDAARCVMVFTDASCHMVTSIPEAGGAIFDDVAREVMAARLGIFLYAPEFDCYHTISMIDRFEWDIVGSLSDATEKRNRFSVNTGDFRKYLEQLAKNVCFNSFRQPAMLKTALPL